MRGYVSNRASVTPFIFLPPLAANLSDSTLLHLLELIVVRSEDAATGECSNPQPARQYAPRSQNSTRAVRLSSEWSKKPHSSSNPTPVPHDARFPPPERSRRR